MAHPQSSPRGLFAKKNVSVPAGGSVRFEDYSSSTGLLAGDSTGLKVAGKIKLGGKVNALVGSNSSGVTLVGVTFTSTSRLLKSNSTGILIGARYVSTNTTSNITT